MASKNGYRQKCLREKGHECDVCGATGDLEVHHIDGDRSNNSLENLVPLCEEHHRAVHRGDDDVEEFVEKLQTREREGMVKVSVSLRQDMHHYLQEWADNNSASFSEAIRRHVRREMRKESAGDTTDAEKDRLIDEVEFLREAVLTAVADGDGPNN